MYRAKENEEDESAMRLVEPPGNGEDALVEAGERGEGALAEVDVAVA